MVNAEQLRIIKEEGVEAWNNWIKKNSDIKIDFSNANLSNIILVQANIKEANLEGVDFSKANLQEADLSKSNVQFANLSKANLSKANLSEVDLRGADLTNANLSEAMLWNAIPLNANLSKANLSGACLRRATFKRANLKGANLRGADLGMLDALGTNFYGANFNGAYVENWHINTETNLKNIICDYIYLENKWNPEQNRVCFSERRPSDPNRIFKPGEFAKYIEKALNTVDLIFTDGIDWKAFFASFKTLQEEYGAENIGVQAIERKSGDTLIVRIEVPPNANKAVIEGHTKQLYESNLKVLEDKYRSELNAKDREIEIYKQKSADILELAKLAASRPITVEAKAVAENQSKNVEVEMNFQAPVTGVAGNVEGNQNIYASEQKQTLAQAAAEIQNLLKQLEQTNPTATVEQQQAYVDAALSPSIKERCVGALKAGSEVAIEEFLDNPYVNVGKAVVKGWIKPESK